MRPDIFVGFTEAQRDRSCAGADVKLFVPLFLNKRRLISRVNRDSADIGCVKFLNIDRNEFVKLLADILADEAGEFQ